MPMARATGASALPESQPLPGVTASFASTHDIRDRQLGSIGSRSRESLSANVLKCELLGIQPRIVSIGSASTYDLVIYHKEGELQGWFQ